MIQEHQSNQQIKTAPFPEAKVSLANILVATDFSKASDRALEHALSLARTYNSKIFLVHVIPTDHMMAPELADAWREKMRRYTRERMDQTLTADRFFGVPHEGIIQEGSLWPNIEMLIKNFDIDLLVLGTHGKGIVEKLLIGSSAEEIFRQARIPVLTVGPEVWQEPFYSVELKNILFATAFGPGAEREAAYAFSLAQEHHSKLTLLHVQQQQGEEQVVIHQLQELIPSSPEMHCLPLFRVEHGDPVREILRVAEDTQANLIVLGAKPRKGLAGNVPHTKAYQVISDASCPVLTIKS
jgi:nucleotide-binding universal stress UspA family protein